MSPYLSEKSSDFHEILYTVADFEPERHVIKNEKVTLDRLEFDRTNFLFLVSHFISLFIRLVG